MLNWLPDLKYPDIAGSIIAGRKAALADTEQSQKNQFGQMSLDGQNALRTLLPQAMATNDPKQQDAIVQKLAAIDPPSAYALKNQLAKGQQDGATQYKNAAGVIASLRAIQDPEARNAAIQSTVQELGIGDHFKGMQGDDILHAASAILMPDESKARFGFTGSGYAPVNVGKGGSLVDPSSGKALYTAPEESHFTQQSVQGPDGKWYPGAFNTSNGQTTVPGQQAPQSSITTDTPIPQDEQAAAQATIQAMQAHPGQPVSFGAVNGAAVPTPGMVSASPRQIPARPTAGPLGSGFTVAPPAGARGSMDEVAKRQAMVSQLRAAGQKISPADERSILMTGKSNSPIDGGSSDPYDGLSPADAALVKGLASYRVKPSELGARPSASGMTRQELIARAQLANPDYNISNAEAANKFVTGLASTSSSSPGGQVNSMNTIAAHMDSLLKANADLTNDENPTMAQSSTANYLRNKVAYGASAAKLTAWNQAAQLVTQEVQKLVKAGVATESETHDFLKGLSQDASPAERNAAINGVAHFALGRVQAVEEQRNRLLGSMSPGTSLLTARAQATFKKIYTVLGKEPSPDMLPAEDGGSPTRNSTTRHSGGTAQPYQSIAVNPKTGEKVGFDGTKWVPIK